MKGLLLSHFLSWRIKSAWMWYFLFIALGFVNFTFGIFSDDWIGPFWLFFVSTTILCGGVMAFGELYNWDKYIVTLPVSRKQIILCQHIETAAYEVCIYLMLILSSIAAIVWMEADICEISYDLILIAAAMSAISVSNIISAAFSGKTGQRGGLIMNMIISGTIMFIVYTYDFSTVCAVFGIIAALIIRAVSIPISIKLYSKRDL